MSLQAKDLLTNPDELAARATALSEVKAAAPVLWSSVILNTIDQSAGLQLMGIDTTSALYDPIPDGVVSGDWLTADDRDGIMIGRVLAESLGVNAGQKLDRSFRKMKGMPRYIFNICPLAIQALSICYQKNKLPIWF